MQNSVFFTPTKRAKMQENNTVFDKRRYSEVFFLRLQI